MEYYIVNIGTGEGNCEVLRIEDNQLVCQPPKHEPAVNQSLSYTDGTPRVYVSESLYDLTYMFELINSKLI